MSVPRPPSAIDPQELSKRITTWATGSMTKHHSPPAPPNRSPISSLPPEMLSEVFLFCLPDDKYPTPSVTAAPLLPMQVCRQWRYVATHTPELWSALHLNYRSSNEDIPATKLWLENSGDLPLSLSLSIDFNERPHQAIINHFCRHARRWKHVRFEFRQLSCPPMYNLAAALDNVPMLSTFEFHGRDVSTCNLPPITQLLSSAPRLKELAWVDDLADTETLLALPLSRLARMTLSMSYGKLDYLGLLDQCENLEHIRITRPFPELKPSQTPILLPKLTSLNITHDLTGILNYLILPSLKHVRVHLDEDTADHETRRYSRLAVVHPGASAGALQRTWDSENLVKLIERSSCHIETLTISAPLADGDLTKCLKACDRSLRSLSVRGAQATPALVDLLSRPGGGSSYRTTPSFADVDDGGAWLCPRLTELVIDSRIPNACSLVELVKRRMGMTPDDGSSCHAASSSHRIAPFERLLFHYPAGHKDVSVLQDIAFAFNATQAPRKLDLRIVELRTGNLRGSSAGRMHSSQLYRRKACASR